MQDHVSLSKKERKNTEREENLCRFDKDRKPKNETRKLFVKGKRNQFTAEST